MSTGYLSRLFNQQQSKPAARRIAGSMGIAILLAATSMVCAQEQTTTTKITVPDGYTAHHSVDLGGRMTNLSGSGAMYDTMVNLQSGPRVQGESLELHALPGTKNPLVDNLSAFGSGFGGDPNIFAKLSFSKGKLYDFSGLFRRDRQYFDYDLLGNPNIPSGQSIAIGPANAPIGAFAWPQVMQSPFSFNTVRRMTDTNLTLLPLSSITYRFGYSQNIFQGPSLSPSGYQFAKYNAILQENQRNSTDDFLAAVDWKPIKGTKLTFEEEINHYKADSFFTLAPGSLTLQEADGTPVAINDYDSLSPYSISACNANSIGTAPLLSAPNTPGGLPVINAACAVVTSYQRSQPTRIITPTESLMLQSSSVRNLSMNGDVRYMSGNMTMPDYYDSYQGLNGATRSLTYTGNAKAKRYVLAADFGAVFQATKTFDISDQVTFSSTHQPGTAVITSGTTLATPATANNETINYNGTLNITYAAAGASSFEGSPSVGTPLPGYFGQSFIINNLTGTWDATPRVTLSLTYRYGSHVIAQGSPHNVALAVGQTTNGTVTINENGGIFNAALRPASNWEVNGTVEVLYDDNSFTPVGARQTKHYRVHTMYRPKSWATISGAYTDIERHNNTNNNQAAVTAGDDPYEGPLDHVDYSRVGSFSADLTPSEHYGFDISYAYSDVYTATNICFDNGNQVASTKPGVYPGVATLTASGAPNVCPGVYGRGSTTQLADWFGRDFMDAPTQSASAAVILSPNTKLRSNIGYRVNDVNGSQFFNDARAVNGSLVSKYQSPFVNVAYTMHQGLIWKAEYNYFGYGEGGPSGAEYCSFSTSVTSQVVPCASLSAQTGLTEPSSGETAPRNFHANNVTLGVHYEF